MFVFKIGALAITVANPTDLVKVRLQSEGKLPPGVPRRYSGAMNAYSTIVRQVGYLSLIHKGAVWLHIVFFCFLIPSLSPILFLILRKALGLCGLVLDPM